MLTTAAAPQLQPLAEPAAAEGIGVTPEVPAAPPPACPAPAEADAAMQAVEVYTPERLQTVEVYITEHHQGSWHTTLNNHASTRPKAYGGPLVHALTACKSFSWRQAAPGSACRVCLLDVPNSFAPSDGRRLQAEGSGKNNQEASENACRRAVAQLLLAEPSLAIPRPAHSQTPTASKI